MWCVLAELSLGRVASLTSGEGESCWFGQATGTLPSLRIEPPASGRVLYGGVETGTFPWHRLAPRASGRV